MKTCKIEGCLNKVWSKGLCLRHTEKKPLKSKKKSIRKISEKGLIKKEEKKLWLEEVHNWEFSLFDKQKDENGYCYCFETGQPMNEGFYKENLCIYSHILPKGVAKYKKYAMEEWNVKIVLPEYHTYFENRSEKALKQLELEKELKELYG